MSILGVYDSQYTGINTPDIVCFVTPLKESQRKDVLVLKLLNLHASGLPSLF